MNSPPMKSRSHPKNFSKLTDEANGGGVAKLGIEVMTAESAVNRVTLVGINATS